MTERTYQVPDVSCGHCVNAITTTLKEIDGIDSVDVDLSSKVVTVRHAEHVDEQTIVAGIEEAGYSVAS